MKRNPPINVSTAKKKAQKRRRPEWDKSHDETKQDDKNVEAEVLTPHTLRLLKLIQEGSTDHARMAATQLRAITAGSSPLVLWDILGRLQFFLTSPDWRCRHNASLAMEGVAQHLPVIDQRRFLQEESKQMGKEHLWLTLADLKGKLKTILQDGRTLMASSEMKYDEQEEEELENFDHHVKGQAEFCEQRMQLQRSILARRLGLSGVLGQYSGKDVEAVVTSADLIPSVPSRTSPIAKRRKEDKEGKPNSVRALLVMEIQQQGESSMVSHRNSQSLLATELIYRMFDASWHVRHGSLMGILSIMRAWRIHQSEESFGVWPHDILARCLCILAMDRFGDYSGASVESSGGVVSPVREMAGQVFSIIFNMSPPSIQEDSFHLLLLLSKETDWEIRHGALTALKYATALIMDTSTVDSDSRMSLLSNSAKLAIEKLEDQSDDVQGVSARLLSLMLAEKLDLFQSGKFVTIVEIAKPLWKALVEARLVSSCIRDLVGLFSDAVSIRCDVVLGAVEGGKSIPGSFYRVLARLNELLGCELTSVKSSIIRAVGSVSSQLDRFCSSYTTKKDKNWNNMVDCYCKILINIYDIYYQHTMLFDGTKKDSLIDTFISDCFRTWNVLASASKNIFEGSDARQSNVVASLLLRYFGVSVGLDRYDQLDLSTKSAHLTKASFDRSLEVRLDLADVISRFLIEHGNGGGADDYDILELCLCACLNSPLTWQCEAACFLCQSLTKNLMKHSIKSQKLWRLLESCREMLCETMEETPLCIVVESSKALVSNPGLSQILLHCLACGVEMVNNQKQSGRSAAESVLDLWKEAIRQQITNIDTEGKVMSKDFMRLLVTLTGVFTAGDHRFLPTKLTPLVRSLMTSFKNESDEVCQIYACSHMSDLLETLSTAVPPAKAGGFKKTRSIVLKRLCDLIRIHKEPGTSAASRIIGSVVKALPVDGSFHDFESISSALILISECNEEVPTKINEALYVFEAVCNGLQPGRKTTEEAIKRFLHHLVVLNCTATESSTRKEAFAITKTLCTIDATLGLSTALPSVTNFLQDNGNDGYRVRACKLLLGIVDATGMSICPFVRSLLPVAMSLMTDPIEECAKTAATIFSSLVQVAPLVRDSASLSLMKGDVHNRADLVMAHLINGKPLPPCDIHSSILKTLESAGVKLRPYQMEGVAWLRFLQTVRLNGALCDSMGLGKTLQSLLGIALSHVDLEESLNPISLVVCPSSVVGHWVKEVERFFPGKKVFQVFSLAGPAKERSLQWDEISRNANLVVTNYSVLRSDIEKLSKMKWHYCILDEGHLLKNPKTATARASRLIRARHKLILTGTPVQNKVHEVWATFDFLMPNFLGSSSAFSVEFAKPITKGQLFGASASELAKGMEKLKILHQQVLPFILRREKEQVLKELPPKIITVIPCDMSEVQKRLYQAFCSGVHVKQSLLSLQRALEAKDPRKQAVSSLGSDVLKTLLYLRLLCTHPCLVMKEGDTHRSELQTIECSGKLVALKELLRNAGVYSEELAAADNDRTLLYCESDSDGDETKDILEPDLEKLAGGNKNARVGLGSKCLIFAQFTHSLDVVEEFLLKRHMPSVKYLRMCGRVPQDKRSDLVEMFNKDERVRILLLTTRIGGLGLNLTGADTVIFLEHDWNPHSDIQSMDRAHRIGQTKTVNVYKLVTTDSVEEKIMKLHETKLAMSNAIVNTDNSSMFSMGTDRLLDIFSFRSGKTTGNTLSNDIEHTLDALVERYEDEYESFSLGDFTLSFKNEDGVS